MALVPHHPLLMSESTCCPPTEDPANCRAKMQEPASTFHQSMLDHRMQDFLRIGDHLLDLYGRHPEFQQDIYATELVRRLRLAITHTRKEYDEAMSRFRLYKPSEAHDTLIGPWRPRALFGPGDCLLPAVRAIASAESRLPPLDETGRVRRSRFVELINTRFIFPLIHTSFVFPLSRFRATSSQFELISCNLSLIHQPTLSRIKMASVYKHRRRSTKSHLQKLESEPVSRCLYAKCRETSSTGAPRPLCSRTSYTQ